MVDQEILERIQAGDKSACALCIETYGAPLYRLALRLMQDEAEAEDIVQESFMNAFKGIDSFEGRSGLGTWLYRITYNTAMMRLRKPSPDTISVETTLVNSDEGFKVPEQFYDWCCLPEADFQTDEVRAQLEAAIATLTPSLRSAFTLRELEGLSTREAAETLQVSEDVVKTRLRRARLQLREELSEFFAERMEQL